VRLSGSQNLDRAGSAGEKLSELHSALLSGFGQIPFGGRMAIRPLVGVCHDAETSREKMMAWIFLAAVLGVSLPVHLIQAEHGQNVAEFYQSWYDYRPKSRTEAAVVIERLYSFTNFGVLYAQSMIGASLATDLWMRRHDRAESGAIPRARGTAPIKTLGLEVGVTAAGQAVGNAPVLASSLFL
jgi:hypothetical protein